MTEQTLEGISFNPVESVRYAINRQAKRSLDVVVSSIALAASAPLMAAITLAVKISSKGPVIYESKRLGENETPFTMYKFRTMRNGAQKELDELVQDKEYSDYLHLKRNGDPRVTKVGTFLRKYSLDELPQFYNVLKGDMSLVGPRPDLRKLYSKEWLPKTRTNCPQGITGLAQINGRDELSPEEKNNYDSQYLKQFNEGRTFLTDLKILIKTIPAVLSRNDAY